MYHFCLCMHRNLTIFLTDFQLMIQNCIDLTLCLLALLQAETTSAIKHLLQMMSSLHDVGQFELLQVISQLCLPQGELFITESDLVLPFVKT